METDDYKLLLRLRNNLSFHYDGKLAWRALGRILEARPDDMSSISHGTEVLHWHFGLADKIANSIFARDVLGLQGEEDLSKRADEIIKRLFDLHEALGDFALHIARHYFAK
jgi:hypothetical protein